MEVDIPLTHQSLGSVHRELSGVLLELPHHWAWCLHPTSIHTQVFSDPDITINTVLLWNSLETFISPPRQCILACWHMVSLCCPSHDTCLHVACAVQDTAACTGWCWILCHAACGIHVFQHPRKRYGAIESGWTRTVRLKWCSGSSSSLSKFSQKRFIDWCSSEVLASVPMGTVSNCIYSYNQNHLWMSFILTWLI